MTNGIYSRLETGEMNEKARILVVDDNLSILHATCKILRDDGYETIEAATGMDALRLAKELRPDLALLDVMLPDINGDEVCRRIKADVNSADIYVVLISSIKTERECQTLGLEIGADCYIARPVSNRELLARLESLLRLKRTEKGLRESQEQLALAIEGSGVGLWDWRIQTGQTIFNERWAKIIGYTLEELAPVDINTWQKFAHPEDLQKSEELLQKHFAGETQDYECEARMKHKDGHWVWILDRGKVTQWDEAGKPLRMTGTHLDITERKLAELELKRYREALEEMVRDQTADLCDSELKYRTVAEFTYDMEYWIATDGSIPYMSPSCERITGYRADEFVNNPALLTDIIHPGDRSTLGDHFDRIDCDVPHSVDFRILTRSGDERWIEHRCQAIFDASGVCLGRRVSNRDITVRKRIEDELRQSEEKFSKVFHCAPALMTVSNADDATFLDVNDAFCEASGFSREECIGKTSIEVGWLTPEERMRLLGEFKAHGSVRGMDLMTQTRDRKEMEILYSGELLETSGRQLLLSTAVDITERKRIEQQRQRLVKVVEQVSEGIVITDTDGIIQYVNPAEEIISGYSRSELTGRSVDVFESGKHDEDFMKNMWETIKSGKAWSGKFVNRKKDGTEYHEQNNISPIYDESGNLINFVAVKRDVTKQIELQNQLFQAQKMEAIGTLTGGIAHDFNNILQVIIGYSELMCEDERLPEDLDADILKISEVAIRGAELVRRLLTFSRKSDYKPQPLDLNRRITDLRKMLKRMIPNAININFLAHEALPGIYADPTQIDQLVMNLVINARDAMPEGGNLTFETARIVLDKTDSELLATAHPGPYVQLTVTDTGTGMDDTTLSHMYEPFFTTKTPGKGTGLGLAVVHGIVEQHGGFVVCESKPGVGTTFRVNFPAIDSSIEIVDAKVNKLALRGSEKILLVDDDYAVLDVCKQVLEKHGYSALVAGSAKEALKIYKESSSEISLVLLDLMMPEMSGAQCLDELLNLNPSLKVIIMSGHMGDDRVGASLIAGAKAALRKPFKSVEVLEVVKKVLNSGS